MADEQQRIIIITRRTRVDVTGWDPAAVERLRSIQARAESGASLTPWQKLRVAVAAFRGAGRDP